MGAEKTIHKIFPIPTPKSDRQVVMSYPDGLKVPLGQGSEQIREDIIQTVSYVKKNGPILEEVKRNDPKYSFVNPDNEYHEFYQYLLREQNTARSTNVAKGDLEPLENMKPKVPQEPYAFSFMSYDKNVARRDLEAIKLAAGFCIANEKADYLEKMKNRFKDDPKFGFLCPGHALNSTFVQFLNQYKQVKANILAPPMFQLKKKEDFKNIILKRSFQRGEYREYEKEVRAAKDETLKLHKIQFAAIDWSNFKVLTNVTLPTSQEPELMLPKPLNFSKLSIKRIDQGNELELFETSEKDVSNKDIEPSGRKRKIRAAGETRLKRRNTASPNANNSHKHLIKCPLTQKMIPEENFDKHLRVLLGDPHYKLEREKYEAKHKLTNLTSNEVYENIKKIAKKSTN